MSNVSIVIAALESSVRLRALPVEMQEPAQELLVNLQDAVALGELRDDAFDKIKR